VAVAVAADVPPAGGLPRGFELVEAAAWTWSELLLVALPIA
jgi:hypothetical protein